jgi:hypothetical protein
MLFYAINNIVWLIATIASPQYDNLAEERSIGPHRLQDWQQSPDNRKDLGYASDPVCLKPLDGDGDVEVY